MRILYFLIFTVLFTACQRSNVTSRDEAYKPIFEKYKVNGTFALYDNLFGQHNIYNIKRYRDSSFSPAGTFQIMSALVGIETGKIIENEAVPFTGDGATPDSLKKAFNFEQAFKQSADWYFKKVLNDIGVERLGKMLDSIAYGSKKIIGSIDSFYWNNTLTIKPDEQLGLMKRLYFSKLEKFFSQRTMNKVKDAMLKEKTDKYALSYKTGLTQGKNGKPLAWVVGWLVKDGNQNSVFPFVLNIEGDMSKEVLAETSMKLLRELLVAEKALPQ